MVAVSSGVSIDAMGAGAGGGRIGTTVEIEGEGTDATTTDSSTFTAAPPPTTLGTAATSGAFFFFGLPPPTSAPALPPPAFSVLGIALRSLNVLPPAAATLGLLDAELRGALDWGKRGLVSIE